MKHLFYFLAILPILYEIVTLNKPKLTHNFINRLKQTKGENFSRKQNLFIFLELGYAVWNFIGLFTFQWIVFLFLFLLGLIRKKYIIMIVFDSLISIIILLFIVLNAYQFKIDTYSLFLSLFK